MKLTRLKNIALLFLLLGLDVAQLDYSNEELRKAMIDAMKYWVYTANIDGFRFDAANNVPFDFWRQAVSELRAIPAHKLLLLAEGDQSMHFEAGFDYIFGFDFFYTLKDQVIKHNWSVSVLQKSHSKEYAYATDATQRVVRYISNHDVNIYEGTPQELFGGKKEAMASFVVAAYMKSVPMIYNGQEIGYPKRLEFFSRTPINWSAADEAVLAEHQKIISFYKSSKAIRNGDLTSYSSNNIMVFTR